MQFFKTLKQKFIFYLLLCSILPAIAIFLSITYIGKHIVKDWVTQEITELSFLLQKQVNQFIEVKKQAATLLASDRHIRDELKALRENTSEHKPRQKMLCTYLSNRCKSLKDVVSVMIINNKGMIIASSDTMHLNEDRSDTHYYTHYKKNRYGHLVSDVYFSEEYNRSLIDFIAPVSDEHGDTSLGLLLLKVDKSALDRITTGETPAPSSGIPKIDIYDDVQDGGEAGSRAERRKGIIRKGATREAYIVNKDKLMITPSRFFKDTFLKQRVSSESVIYTLKNKKSFSGIYKDYRGKMVLGISRFFEEPGWVLLLETDLNEAFLPVKRVRYVALIAIGSGIGGLIILSVTLRVMRHILFLEKGLKNISSGDLNTYLEHDYRPGDELGERLAGSFNEMALAVKKSEETLRNLFDAANDPMFIIKEGEKIVDMNKRVTEVFGYERESLIGSNLTTILTTRYIPLTKLAIDRTWKLSPDEKYVTFDVSVVTRDNEELNCELDLNRTANGIQPHFRDVTKTKRLEKVLEKKNRELEDMLANLKEVQAQLIQAGKLAGIGELASGVAHEINNPLTAVMGHALRLMRKAEGSELKEIKGMDTFRKELKIIADASMRCKEITDGLLRFSRVSTEPKKSSVNVNNVIDDSLVLIEYTFKKHRINLVKQLDAAISYIRGDHNQLQQVFINMINNAIHAMPNGGDLHIATRERQNIPFSIYRRKKSGNGYDDYIEVEFADTGCGIEEKHLSNIFDPFFTTKEPGKGTGLGLSVSYRIISDHDGWIEVKSAVGKGTSFLIFLPVVKNKKEHNDEVSPENSEEDLV